MRRLVRIAPFLLAVMLCAGIAHADVRPPDPCADKAVGDACTDWGKGDGICEEVPAPNRGAVRLAKEPATRVVCAVEKQARKSNKAAFIAIGCALGAVAIAVIAARGKSKPTDPGEAKPGETRKA